MINHSTACTGTKVQEQHSLQHACAAVLGCRQRHGSTVDEGALRAMMTQIGVRATAQNGDGLGSVEGENVHLLQVRVLHDGFLDTLADGCCS